MRSKRSTVVTFFLLSFFFSKLVFGENYVYPELEVTPRASERLQIQMQYEPKYDWTLHLPLQIASLSNLIGGIMQLSTYDKSVAYGSSSGWAGIIVGGGWLAGSYFLGKQYRPYGKTMEAIAKMPGKSQREQLIRERLAEEGIRAAALSGRRIKWISFLSNLAAAGYMISKVDKKTSTNFVHLISAAAAFGPLFFPYRWERIYCEQNEYKKKIYGPIASSALFYDSVSNKFVPGLNVSLTF